MSTLARFYAATFALFVLPALAYAQAGPKPFEPVGQDGARIAAPQTAPAPAPKRDLTGTWLPAVGAQGQGAAGMPADGKPEHDLPFTPKGLQVYQSHKTSNGTTPVPAAEENDPGHICDPLGFPRSHLFELRATRFIQTPLQLILLYTYDKTWRTIWSDGRALPKDPDPTWFGHSVGKWTDDYTFVVDTNGTDDRTWLDNAGRPHSEDLKVQEVYHRIDRDNMELMLTIDDPQMYTKPWIGLNKLRFRLLPPNTELLEMMCSPSEADAYNKRHANPAAEKK
ncbi:MAG: hypothetical protein ABL995_00005 [Bryobacteraceae bacterium]